MNIIKKLALLALVASCSLSSLSAMHDAFNLAQDPHTPEENRLGLVIAATKAMGRYQTKERKALERKIMQKQAETADKLSQEHKKGMTRINKILLVGGAVIAVVAVGSTMGYIDITSTTEALATNVQELATSVGTMMSNQSAMEHAMNLLNETVSKISTTTNELGTTVAQHAAVLTSSFSTTAASYLGQAAEYVAKRLQ